MDTRGDQQAFGIACVWAVRGRNRLSGPLRILVLVGDMIKNAGGASGWLSCSNLRCLGLSGVTLCLIHSLQNHRIWNACGILPSLSLFQHSGHRINEGVASPQNCGKTGYYPWNLCLVRDSRVISYWVSHRLFLRSISPLKTPKWEY